MNPENDGEVSSCVPGFHYQAAGWCDNDAANLLPVAPLDKVQRIVPLMGVCDDVLAAAEATEKIGYTCAAQLVEYLYRLDPTN